ncbi:Hypothetical_protein [Hexamita inflata]|uniref:Hypothetical_protein n=1 Tax=Hexamita inflata TaxID=28002 RepID=A0AA86ND48_9EUKA|nr:Hypothetical protein HINF_LOCUS4736 [Hexamita inflata]
MSPLVYQFNPGFAFGAEIAIILQIYTCLSIYNQSKINRTHSVVQSVVIPASSLCNSSVQSTISISKLNELLWNQFHSHESLSNTGYIPKEMYISVNKHGQDSGIPIALLFQKLRSKINNLLTLKRLQDDFHKHEAKTWDI